MYCNKCDRGKEFLCEYPCLDFQGVTNVFSDVDIPPVGDNAIGVSYGIQLHCSEEYLEDYLEYDVSQDEWLDVLKGKMTIEKMVNFSSLLSYMEGRNMEYCSKNNLCPECRSELVEVRDQYEYWGSKVSGEKVWICPRCGY